LYPNLRPSDGPGGVYVLMNLETKEVFLVGRSVDVRRRIDWWHEQDGGWDRYRGVVLLYTQDVDRRRVVEQGALERYGTLRTNKGAFPDEETT
jgi:hypothetical protein